MKALIFRSSNNTELNGVVIKNIQFYPDIMYPVMLNFDNTKYIGDAVLSEDSEGNIYADIELVDGLGFKYVYPALGCVVDDESVGHVRTLGLCSNPNIDPGIPPINI